MNRPKIAKAFAPVASHRETDQGMNKGDSQIAKST